jgi:hypothetical protein
MFEMSAKKVDADTFVISQFEAFPEVRPPARGNANLAPARRSAVTCVAHECRHTSLARQMPSKCHTAATARCLGEYNHPTTPVL